MVQPAKTNFCVSGRAVGPGQPRYDAAEGLDYASLFAKAGRAGVFRAVAGGCAAAPAGEGRKTLDGIAAREARKQRDAAALLAALENGGVDCLPLDGFAFGALYTGKAKREMKDFNILIREQHAEKADRLLTKRGLELFREGAGVGCYRGKNAPNIFLHTQSGAYGGRFPLWEWARPLEGVHGAYTLSPEQRFLCVLARAEDAKKAGKCAAKPLLDVFVLRNAYDGTWNDDYIQALTETYGLASVKRDTDKLYGCFFEQNHRDGYYFQALDSFFGPGQKALPPAAAGPLRRARRKRAKTAAIYVSAAAVVIVTVVICSMLRPARRRMFRRTFLPPQRAAPKRCNWPTASTPVKRPKACRMAKARLFIIRATATRGASSRASAKATESTPLPTATAMRAILQTMKSTARAASISPTATSSPANSKTDCPTAPASAPTPTEGLRRNDEGWTLQRLRHGDLSERRQI